MKNFRKLREQALRQQYRKKEVFVEGDYIMNAITGQKGRIHRAGVNYVICVTEDGEMFRAWVKDIRDINRSQKTVYKYKMDKQRAVNTVTANDEYSKQLMKMYENWMGGECFQGSNINEEEIPTGQKQGGGTGAAFKSAIGELPAIEYDKSGAIPTPSVVNSDDGSQKDPKSNANPGEPPVALKGTMTIGQGSMSTGQPQSHGAQLKNMTLVSKEQVEIDGEMYVIEKAKGLDGKACWKGYKLAGTKKKGGKTVDNCVKAGFEPEGEQLEEKKAKKDYDGDGKIESGKDEYFGSRDKAIKKAMAKKGMKKEEIENLFAEIEEHHEKDKDGNTIPHKEEVKTEEWKSNARKMTSKIMSYYGKKRDS